MEARKLYVAQDERQGDEKRAGNYRSMQAIIKGRPALFSSFIVVRLVLLPVEILFKFFYITTTALKNFAIIAGVC